LLALDHILPAFSICRFSIFFLHILCLHHAHSYVLFYLLRSLVFFCFHKKYYSS
jgi:hypothetical protein